MRQRIALSPKYKYWASPLPSAVAIGTFASVMDYGSVNIAVPTIATHFRTDLPSVQWVVIAYALTISALLLPMGRLSDLIGRKRVYISGSIIFILGAALAGSSSNLPMLVLGRILQGSGAAMTQGTGMAIITSAFPASERGKAIGLIMTVVGTGAVAGPAVGGLLVDALGWRSVFFVNVPMISLAIAAAVVILRDRPAELMGSDGSRAKFDWLGAGLSSGALLTLLLALSAGHRYGWGSPAIVGALLGFGTLLGTFIWWELRTSSPLLDLRLFKRRTFSYGISANWLSFLGSSSVLFLMPFYLQRVLGFSPQASGVDYGARCPVYGGNGAPQRPAI